MTAVNLRHFSGVNMYKYIHVCYYRGVKEDIRIINHKNFTRIKYKITYIYVYEYTHIFMHIYVYLGGSRRIF
jgi:hypothetical protein